MKTLYPVLNTDALDMLKVLAVVSHHHESFGLCCTTDKQVEVVNLLSSLPECCSLFGKGMNGFVISLVFVYLVEPFFDAAFSSEQEYADAGVKQISFHSSTSNVFLVRAERMSLTISSADRESFHVPAKRLAQPFLCGAACSSATVMELLSKAISSIFSVLLKSFSFDQYRAQTGDVTFKPFILIYILVCYSACKVKHFF